MKNIKYLIIISTIIANHAHATVRTLNNNNPGPGQYLSWSTVQAASNFNDTIYVSGSSISYGDITITKDNLTIIGTGHNPQKQNPYVSRFENIEVLTDQLTVLGLDFQNINTPQNTNSSIDIRVENCRVRRGINLFSVNLKFFDVIIKNNIISADTLPNGSITSLFIDNTDYPAYPVSISGTIMNNIFLSSIYLAPFSSSSMSCIINNNTFISNGFGTIFYSGYGQIATAGSFTFNNNIVIGYNTANFSDYNVNNNCFYNGYTLFPSATGGSSTHGLNPINSNPLFTNVPTYVPYQITHNYQLQNGSPCKNAGTDGTDIGPYGGLYGGSFSTDGEPPIPQIKEMNMPATVISGNSFNVNIISKVK